MFLHKIRHFLFSNKRSEKPELYRLCERIYLKIIYLYVALQNQETEDTIREMASNLEHPDRFKTYIFLLDNAGGLKQLLNYFEEAPNSALATDRRFLETFMNA
jgi:hypothetical protein